MDLYVLNPNFIPTRYVDMLDSFLWVDRYNESGEFELTLSASKQNMADFPRGNYFQFDESDRLMRIESRQVLTDSDDGDKMIVRGRSLDSILEQRIVWNQTDYRGSLYSTIRSVLTSNVVSPSISARAIPNFTLGPMSSPELKTYMVEKQYTGDVVYDVIQEICSFFDVGFKTVQNGSGFLFDLYVGIDRSYEQTTNPFVVFSPNFDNLLSSDRQDSIRDLKNVAHVGGEGEGSARKFVDIGSATGLNRRELYVNAADIQSKVDDVQMTDAEYRSLLRARGSSELRKSSSLDRFTSEVDDDIMFKYGKDYYLGDIVQVEDAYGNTGRCRVSEVVYTFEDGVVKVGPTFTNLNSEEI